jgi:hypothetical protein
MYGKMKGMKGVTKAKYEKAEMKESKREKMMELGIMPATKGMKKPMKKVAKKK